MYENVKTRIKQLGLSMISELISEWAASKKLLK